MVWRNKENVNADGTPMGSTAIAAGSVTAHRHDGLFNDFRIKFMSIPTGLTVDFAGILGEFSDAHASSWDQAEYYGRMDPVAKFKNTKRTITFTFSVLADDPVESGENLARYQKLVRMLYPVYKRAPDASVNPFQTSNAATISSPPLIGIKFANLIQQSKPASGDMLVGYVDGFEMSPDADLSYWYANGIDDTVWELPDVTDDVPMDRSGNKAPRPRAGGAATSNVDGPILLPRKFDVAVTFNVLHTHPVGFTEDGEWDTAAGDYPYGADQLNEAFPDHMREEVEITYGIGIAEAKVPLSVKKGMWGAILGALFGPPGINNAGQGPL